VNPALSNGLTPFLAPQSGLHSGFMIAQVTAAALVSENKIHCHPASVDSIPTSAAREDHVSMGSISACKLARVVENVANVIAVELIVGAQGVEQRRPLRPSSAVSAAHAAVRRAVPPLTEDRPLYEDIARTKDLILSGELQRAIEDAVGSFG
jgi:histidine ammonia-lyase